MSTAQLGKLLAFDGAWQWWTCPKCGEEVGRPAAMANAAGALPFGAPCGDCRPSAGAPTGKPRDRQGALLAAGCPPRYANVPFLEPASWPRDARQPEVDPATWTGDPWCVVLAGEVESGKTMLATELLWRGMQRGLTGLWLRAGDVIRRAYGQLGAEAKAELWASIERAGILLVDDLGRGHEGDAWGTIGELVAVRYDTIGPTIWTTNRRMKRVKDTDPKGLADADPAAYRRLREGLVVQVRGRWTA